MLSTKSKTPQLLFLLVLLLNSSFQIKAIPFQQWRTLFSLSHSLMLRVAELRASRGDYEGSERARRFADKLGGGLGLWRGMWSIGWDYMRNYAWRDMSPTEMFQAASDMNQLYKALNKLTQLKSGKEITAWVLRNYQNVLVSLRSLFQKLLQVFYRSGPLRDLVLMLQREVEGGLLRDCLEIGSNDMKGLFQVLNDLAAQLSRGSNNGRSGSCDL